MHILVTKVKSMIKNELMIVVMYVLPHMSSLLLVTCVVTDLVCKHLFSYMSEKHISHTVKFIQSDFLHSFLSFLNLHGACERD